MKQKIYRIKSPAKINIGLRVIDKRNDGYHNIETIFYPIPLFDEIGFNINIINSRINIISVKTNPELDIPGKKNICYKTAEYFFEQYKINGNYRIEILIDKIIPAGAGLGGGSSNAASILILLAKHFKINPGDAGLKELALKLGSDVPFFLSGKPAFAESRGEKLSILPRFRINYDILIVYPGIHVSTKWAYEKINSKKQIVKSKKSTGTQLKGIVKFDANSDVYQNDFEEAVFEEYPEIKAIKEEMYNKEAVYSSMSGSGSAVYGFFEKNIIRKSQHFRKKGYKVFVIKRK